MKHYVNIQVHPETKARIKVKAAQRKRQIKDHVDDLSRLPNKVVEDNS